jgi:riboflavin kinase/FMN adenylyltransferase
VLDAMTLLGRPYEIEGEVVPGDRRGREIGVPTANVRTEQLLPAEGVYAGAAVLPGGARHAAAINVGTRPTFGGVGRRLEVHIIRENVAGAWAPLPGLPEYGWEVRVEFTAWVRDDLRFDSVRALCDQMARDIARCRDAARGMAGPAARGEYAPAAASPAA